MTRKKKLYSKARTVSANLSFSELCLLAESAGFEFRRAVTGDTSILSAGRC